MTHSFPTRRSSDLDELGGRLAVDQRVGVLQALVDARGHPQLQLRVERGVADLLARQVAYVAVHVGDRLAEGLALLVGAEEGDGDVAEGGAGPLARNRKSTRLNSSH